MNFYVSLLVFNFFKEGLVYFAFLTEQRSLLQLSVSGLHPWTCVWEVHGDSLSPTFIMRIACVLLTLHLVSLCFVL